MMTKDAAGAVKRSTQLLDQRLDKIVKALRKASEARGEYYDGDMERALHIAKCEAYSEIASIIESSKDE